MGLYDMVRVREETVVGDGIERGDGVWIIGDVLGKHADTVIAGDTVADMGMSVGILEHPRVGGEEQLVVHRREPDFGDVSRAHAGRVEPDVNLARVGNDVRHRTPELGVNL